MKESPKIISADIEHAKIKFKIHKDSFSKSSLVFISKDPLFKNFFSEST